MVKTLFVIYLIILSIGLAASYAKECAIGPDYWCKSFENAQNCGAITHCTDTVWSNDNKYALVDSSITCQWCQRILGNIQQGLEDNENLAVSTTLTSGCKLLQSTDQSSRCVNAIENYETSIISLMKNKRFPTLCRLMNICLSENPSVIVGNKRCTWGPSYWCSSLSNSRECSAIDRCSTQIWSQQSIKKPENDNICQYCEYVIDKLRSTITENKTEINVEKWLTGACSMLRTQTTIDECVQTMSHYAEEILILIKNNIDSGLICHLGQMCKEATIIPREKSTDEQSKMLCNVIVRATYELHINQDKEQNEIEIFLKNDCQKLSNSELKEKCGDLVEQYGDDIYGHIANNMELSKICDNFDFQSRSHVHCNLCTFVLTATKSMLDANNPEDKVLDYIDENFCSNLNGKIKENCKTMIESNGNDLINEIKQGKQSMLICTYFQVCYDEIIDKTSPIEKNEIRSFLKENICDHLGPFKDSCNALLKKDSTSLFKTLVNDVEGNVLCQIFGICPRKTSLIDDLSVNDDTDKCQRCVDDFTRRKNIAEKLLNYSSEFLHHFCGQLSNEDECIKSVDQSINKLIQFIQSLNPQDICVELEMCTEESLENIQITSLDGIISEEVIGYIKNEICANIGPLSNWCDHLMNTEGAGLFNLISKDIDPHKVCSVIDICPTTTAFENCNNKCECCVSKVENYQLQLAAFLETMLTTAEGVCGYIPGSEECREIAAGFKSTINEIIYNFNAKKICQTLTHCSVSPATCDIAGDKCQCCQNNLNIRENNFRKTINEIVTTLFSFCTDDTCRSNLQSNEQQILNQIDKINSLTVCQIVGHCSPEHLQRSIPFLSNLMINTHSDLESSIQDLSDKLCSNFNELKPICKHMISIQNTRYMNVYMALLKNNSTLIDNDLHEQSTDTCDGCKNAVKSSKDFWINSLESIRNVLLQTCEYCSVKGQCRDFFNQRFNNLTSYINEIDPEKFCQSLHLCSLALIDTCSTCIQRLDVRKDGFLQGIDRLSGYFNDLCQKYSGKKCQKYVNKLKDLYQQSIKEFDTKQICSSIGFCEIYGNENEIDLNEYENYLEDQIEKNICSILGPFEILCQNIIKGNTKQIQELKMNYNIGDLMKIGEELTDISSDIEDLNHKDKCQCCIGCVTRRKWRTKFIGDNIFSALDRSCAYCPAKHQCRKYWQIAKAKFDTHIDEVCPKKVCTHLGYCNKTIEIEEIKSIDNSNSTCILCNYVMNILSNYIQSQSTEEEIEENLQKICNQIPSILQNQCREYIDNYSPAIISILIREFNLSTVCQKLNLCTDQMKFNITHIIKADTSTCGICDYISTYIHFILERDSNEHSLRYAVSTVCDHLSDEQRPKCQTIVQLFSPYIRQLKLSPGNNFCKELTICEIPMIEMQPGISIEKEHLIIEKPKETPTCTLCQYVIAYLDAALKNNKSEEAVEEALKKACTILPEKLSAECNQFITEYGSVIAELIAQAADPDTICRYIGICQKSTTIIAQTAHTCNICQYIISRIRYFTGLNQDKTEILVSVKKSCDLFTVTSLQEQCKDFLDRQGAYFSQNIFNKLQPRMACQTIGICDENYHETTSPTPVLSSTKYSKCIFGMKYWCTSRENAELCNAVELCQRQVWSKNNIVIN